MALPLPHSSGYTVHGYGIAKYEQVSGTRLKSVRMIHWVVAKCGWQVLYGVDCGVVWWQRVESGYQAWAGTPTPPIAPEKSKASIGSKHLTPSLIRLSNITQKKENPVRLCHHRVETASFGYLRYLAYRAGRQTDYSGSGMAWYHRIMKKQVSEKAQEGCPVKHLPTTNATSIEKSLRLTSRTLRENRFIVIQNDCHEAT